MSNPRVWLRASIIFAVALLIRLVYLYEVFDVPFVQTPSVDARAYDEWAQAIAAGDWWGSQVFYQAPLYPYFAGAVYSVCGRSLLALHVFQMMIGAGTCVLAYLAGRRFFSERAGLVSACLLVIYPPAIYFDGIMHKEGLGLFLFMLVIFLLAGTLHRPQLRRFLLAGFVTGLLALTRENLLILLLVVPIWLLYRRDVGAMKQRMRAAIVFVCGTIAVLLPVAARNYAVGSTFALSGNFGPNFYFGNNPDATGVYEPLVHNRQDPAYEREDAERIAEQQVGRDLTPGEVSSFWFRRGLRFIADRPFSWLTLTFHKLLLTWNRFEIPDTEDLHLYAEHSTVLGSLRPFLHFGVLAPLAAAGAVLTWRARNRAALLYLLVAAATASVAIFFVFARYRHPLIAPLVLLAGAGLAEMFAVLRRPRAPSGSTSLPGRERGSSGTLLAASGAAAVVAVLTNWPMLDERAQRSVAYVNLASMYERAGEPEKGLAAARRALELYPDNALAHFHHGRISAADGAFEEAERHLLRAVALDPQLHVAHVALAEIYETHGRLEDAALQLRAAVLLAPSDAALHLRLGRLLVQAGAADAAGQELAAAVGISPSLAGQLTAEERTLVEQAQAAESDALAQARRALRAGSYAEAADLYAQAAAKSPDDPALHYEWATALAAMNDPQGAAQHFERAIALAPDFAAAHNDLGQLLTNAGSFDPAIEHYRAAIQAQPDLVPAHYNLATTLAAAGRMDEAIIAMEQCLAVAKPSAPQAVLARIEDRLSRLREERQRGQGSIKP